MQAAIINKAPHEWLLDQGLKPDQVMRVLDSFAGGARPEVLRYGAGSVFYRFQGRQSPKLIWQPNYWVLGEAFTRAFSRAGMFEGFLSDQEIARVAKLHYRELGAISYV